MTIGINQGSPALASVPVGSGKAGAKNQGDGNTFGSVVGLSNPGAKGKGGDMSSTPTIGFQKPEKLGQQKTPVNPSGQEAPRWLRPGAQFGTAIDSEFALKVTAEQADAGEEPQPDEATTDTAADRPAKASGDPLAAMLIATRLEGRGDQSGNGSTGTGKSGAAQTPPTERELSTPKIPLGGESAALADAARTASANGGKETAATVANFRLPGQVSGETISIGRIDTKNGAKSAAAELTRSLSQATGAGDTTAEGAEPATSSIGDDFRQSLEAGSRGRQQADTSGRHPEGKAERITVLAQQNIPAPIAQSPVSTASTLATQIASDAGWREAAAPSFRPLAAQPNLSSAHTLKIQLNPAELGMVTANMRFSGEQLTVEIQVENGDAYRRLSADTETIVKSLRAMGIDIDRVTVQQPQAATQSVTRADNGATASGFAPRDQQSFGSTGSGGNGEAPGGQRSGGNSNDGSYGSSDAASNSSNHAGGGLYI